MELEQEPITASSPLVSIPGRGRFHEAARRERLEFLRRRTGAALKSFETPAIAAESLRGNIENYIGTMALPVGAAGPLLLHHGSEPREVYAPIATTEGALVASITRGARAISLSGGAHARFIAQSMTRAPFFEFQNMDTAFAFAAWVKAHFADLQRLTKDYSNFSNLTQIETWHMGRVVHLVFFYSTADAAGQNMTTICTWQSCQWILEKIRGVFEIRRFVLEGNLSSDKKASVGSVMRGRGIEVTAECLIQSKILKDVLLVNARDMAQSFALSKSARIQTGMLANNINTANLIAGIFAATGQDIACVHESSLAELHLEEDGDDLYASIYLPNLVVGTVGGGTHLHHQREALQLLDCFGAQRVERFAETIAGFALALDLSTLAAMVGGQFAKSHSRLGRPKNGGGVERANVKSLIKAALVAQDVEELEGFNAGDSLIMELSSQATKKLCGFFPARARWADEPEDLVLMKLKPLDTEIMLATEMMGAMCSGRLGELLLELRKWSAFKSCHEKEMRILRLKDEAFLRLAPKVYATLIQPRSQIFASITRLETGIYQPEWNDENLRYALSEITSFHAVRYGHCTDLVFEPWIGFVPSSHSLKALMPLFREMAAVAEANHPSWYTEREAVDRLIDSIPEWAQELDGLEKTLIHGDFNTRNLAFRKNAENRLCAFDWELATVHVPQRDSVELLSFCRVIDPERVLSLLEFQRLDLEKKSRLTIDPAEWLTGARLAIQEFILHRLAMYSVAHVHRHCEFLPATATSAFRILKILEDASADTF